MINFHTDLEKQVVCNLLDQYMYVGKSWKTRKHVVTSLTNFDCFWSRCWIGLSLSLFFAGTGTARGLNLHQQSVHPLLRRGDFKTAPCLNEWKREKRGLKSRIIGSSGLSLSVGLCLPKVKVFFHSKVRIFNQSFVAKQEAPFFKAVSHMCQINLKLKINAQGSDLPFWNPEVMQIWRMTLY